MKSFLLLFFGLLIGCSYYKNQPVHAVEKSRWDNLDSTVINTTRLAAPQLVKRFYQEKNYRLVWVDTAGLTSQADSMLSFIRAARSYGLDPEDYHFSKLNQLTPLPDSKDNAGIIDLYLSDSFIAIHHHLKYGRVEKKSLKIIDLASEKDASALASLNEALSENAIRKQLEMQEPVYPQYHLLKTELKRLLSKTANDRGLMKRIGLLMVNMERWRWQTKPLPERYIIVNAPSFTLNVVEKDSILLQSRVIVGKRETPTPELESTIRSFIIYPYWHVPKSIVKEILPSIQGDSLYLTKHNYEVLDQNGVVVDASALDWPSFSEDNFPYVLRQREGSENTMGVIKFVFNNNYGVYLHDTNARGLFWRDNRALSHGCIRVHKAVELAHYLAKDDDTYVGPEDLDQYLLVQHKMTVDVVKPIPLLLQYFTVAFDKEKAIFYNDIYGKDQEILNAWYHYSLHAQEESAVPLL